MYRRTKALMVAAAVVVAAAGCGSSSKAGGAAAGKTYTIGVLSDATGPAASGNKTALIGAQAGGTLAAQDGITLKFVQADTQSSPVGAQDAAKKLVEEDHVSAVIAVSALTFGAAGYLTAHNVPVIGAAEDGTEWITSKNMFSVFGFLDSSKVGTTYGDLFKLEGVTNVGSLGYGISPQSAEAAKNAAVSSKDAGLTVGYLNANFPFGSTNVQPVALAMKNGGVQGFIASVDPNTGFALVTALRQLNANLKVALLPTGYGGDLTQAGPGAIQAGQGIYFYTSFEPVEMHTAATQRLQTALNAVGVTTEPTYAEYAAYASVALLVDGLKAAGAGAAGPSLISALNGIKGFNGDGLFGSHSFDLDNRGTVSGVDGCIYVTRLSGSQFVLVPGADPICGTLTGQKV